MAQAQSQHVTPPTTRPVPARTEAATAEAKRLELAQLPGASHRTADPLPVPSAPADLQGVLSQLATESGHH